MKTYLLVALCLVTCGYIGQAQDHVTFDSITVATTAIGFAEDVITPPGRPQMTACTARLETAQVRFRFDGAAPTSTEGTLLDVGDIMIVRGHVNLRKFRAIRTGATSGVLKVHCYIENLL